MMSKRYRTPALALVVASVIFGVILAGSTLAGSRGRTARAVVKGGQSVVDVTALPNGAYTLQARHSDNSWTIYRNEITMRGHGLNENYIYHYPGGAWRQARLRFGISKSAVAAAVKATPGSSPQPQSTKLDCSVDCVTIDDFGTDLQGLAQFAGMPIASLGATFRDMSLADSAQITSQDVSSGVEIGATVEYSSDLKDPGAGADQVTLTESAASTPQAVETAKFLNTDKPDFTVGQIVASKFDSGQIVAKDGTLYITITATWDPPDDDWIAILGSLSNVQ